MRMFCVGRLSDVTTQLTETTKQQRSTVLRGSSPMQASDVMTKPTSRRADPYIMHSMKVLYIYIDGIEGFYRVWPMTWGGNWKLQNLPHSNTLSSSLSFFLA